MSAQNRVVVKINASPNTPAGWLAKAKGVNARATSNATSLLASIAALLTQLGSDTEKLDEAQANAANRGKDEVKTRNAAWRVLQKSLRAFAAGVQGLCDAAPDVAHAQAIAAAAGLDSKMVPVRIMPDLRAKALGNGAVRLFGRRPAPQHVQAFYEWQTSSDGKTWTLFTTTNNATTQTSGLTAGTTVWFRYRKTVKNVPSEWSDAVSVIVH